MDRLWQEALGETVLVARQAPVHHVNIDISHTQLHLLQFFHLENEEVV